MLFRRPKPRIVPDPTAAICQWGGHIAFEAYFAHDLGYVCASNVCVLLDAQAEDQQLATALVDMLQRFDQTRTAGDRHSLPRLMGASSQTRLTREGALVTAHRRSDGHVDLVPMLPVNRDSHVPSGTRVTVERPDDLDDLGAKIREAIAIAGGSMDNAGVLEPVPIRMIGYWLGPRSPGWPDVNRFVDPSADAASRERIARRLDAGYSVPWAMGGWSECRICGQRNGSQELTDGRMIWPEGLAHYVRDHQVCLPPEVEDQLGSDPMSEAAAREAVGSSEAFVDFDWWRSLTTR